RSIRSRLASWSFFRAVEHGESVIKIFLPGLFAGMVINVIEWLVHRVWLDSRWTAAFAPLGKRPMGWRSFVVANFLVGIFSILTYRWLSRNSGGGRSTALKTALAIWIVFWAIPIGGLQPMNLFPNYLLALVIFVGVADVALGVLPAIWLYDRMTS